MSTVESEISGYNSLHEAYGDDDEYTRKPKRTMMACTFCRARKIKCDGARPLCSNCNKRSQPCVYAPVAPTNRA